MTSLSSLGSNAWSNSSLQRPARPSSERLLTKVDADQSGGVDTTELQSLLDEVAQKSGVQSSTSATDLLTSYDADSDGSLNADELASTLESVLPQRSTMDFAQARSAGATDSTAATGQAGDDLFSQVDEDGDGSVSQTELAALLQQMAGDSGTPSATTSTDSTDDAEALFGLLDADGDGALSQSEFDAARPTADDTATTQAGGMPPPPPGGMGGAGGPPPTAAASTTYDPLDTNEDGVVSPAELAAAATASSDTDAVTALFNAIDTDGDSTLSTAEATSFADTLTRAYDAAQYDTTAVDDDATRRSTSDNASDRAQTFDQNRLADLARRQYEDTANAGTSTLRTFSAMA